MASVKEIYEFLDAAYPFELQASFDNAGFQLGSFEDPVSRVLCTLDLTEAVAQEAISQQADLILSHHPLFFDPIKSLTDQTRVGRIARMLIQNNIALIAAHTNVDVALDGVNDTLAQKLKLIDVTAFDLQGIDKNGNAYANGRIGLRAAETPSDFERFAHFVKEQLGVDAVRGCDAGRSVERIALIGGGGAHWLHAAQKSGCDTFVTADLEHQDFVEAMSIGVNLIDAGHFKTEAPIISVFAEMLKKRFPELELLETQVNTQPYRHY